MSTPSATLPDPGDVLRARALALARTPPAPPSGPVLEVLEFRLAREHYAIESRHVAAVVPLLHLAPVPCTPAFVRGVMNVRGRITAVLDLQVLLQTPAPGLHDLHHVVLVRSGAMEFGLLAEAVIGARTLPGADLQPPLPSLRVRHLRGITAQRLLVIDFERLAADPGILVNEEGPSMSDAWLGKEEA
ncbi:chemotaxis protein CheW [Ramlibacter humi]|uniref:Purine-binding chemotaxis protein CheW n=1 Tax=Ramlibacter humi TaxID=2530451 RepID=A0A4Z0C9R5_9BURK|nr:chemotaxis protein CheW [Ramlibacter humi]TFZ07714.1 purine-binding chemotaxis protein CheW [Ramlibacter humi]